MQTTTLKGKDKKVKITFYDDAEEIQTGVATYGTYYYQEVDVGKVDSCIAWSTVSDISAGVWKRKQPCGNPLQ